MACLKIAFNDAQNNHCVCATQYTAPHAHYVTIDLNYEVQHGTAYPQEKKRKWGSEGVGT